MDDTLTLPGTIPGLLLRGSPVVAIEWNNHRVPGTVITIRPRDALIGMDDWCHLFGLSSLHLDLTNPTGRAHAAWWVAKTWRSDAAWEDDMKHFNAAIVMDLFEAVGAGMDVDADGIKTLRRIALHIAGDTNG